MEQPFNRDIPLVYVAGPYMGKNRAHNYSEYEEIDQNISRARGAAAWLVQHGFYMICPHMNSAHFEAITPDVPPGHWYALDFRILSHCDAMLVLDGWKESKGTLAEIAYCTRVNIPVYFFGDERDEAALLAKLPVLTPA